MWSHGQEVNPEVRKLNGVCTGWAILIAWLSSHLCVQYPVLLIHPWLRLTNACLSLAFVGCGIQRMQPLKWDTATASWKVFSEGLKGDCRHLSPSQSVKLFKMSYPLKTSARWKCINTISLLQWTHCFPLLNIYKPNVKRLLVQYNLTYIQASEFKAGLHLGRLCCLSKTICCEALFPSHSLIAPLICTDKTSTRLKSETDWRVLFFFSSAVY